MMFFFKGPIPQIPGRSSRSLIYFFRLLPWPISTSIFLEKRSCKPPFYILNCRSLCLAILWHFLPSSRVRFTMDSIYCTTHNSSMASICVVQYNICCWVKKRKTICGPATVHLVKGASQRLNTSHLRMMAFFFFNQKKNIQLCRFFCYRFCTDVCKATNTPAGTL